MLFVTRRGWSANLLLVIALLVGLGASQVRAEEPAMKDGGTEPGKVYLGMRAGFAPLTQQLTPGTSTDVGSLVNFQAMYSLNNWLLIGMMLEWERHSISTEGPSVISDIKIPCQSCPPSNCVQSASARLSPMST